MKKGFTLMEVMAVVLVIAVVASFALPAIREARKMVRYQRAKAGASKMAQAMRTYYQNSKGYLPVDCGHPASSDSSHGSGCCVGEVGSAGDYETLSQAVRDTCHASSPSIDRERKNVAYAGELFACGFLSPKDFLSLGKYYNFCMVDPFATTTKNELIRVLDASDRKVVITVKRDMTVVESE